MKTRKESQQEKIVKYLNSHATMTAMDAIRAFGCTKLATRISELKRKGYLFEQEMIEVVNSDGSTSRVMSYSLADVPEEVA